MSQPDPTTIAADEVAVQAVIGHHAQLAAGLTERVDALVRRVETDQLRTAQTAREDLLAFLRREVLPHARAEEQALYPPAAAHPDGRLLVEGMLAEHAALTALVEELAAASSPPHFSRPGRGPRRLPGRPDLAGPARHGAGRAARAHPQGAGRRVPRRADHAAHRRLGDHRRRACPGRQPAFRVRSLTRPAPSTRPRQHAGGSPGARVELDTGGRRPWLVPVTCPAGPAGAAPGDRRYQAGYVARPDHQGAGGAARTSPTAGVPPAAGRSRRRSGRRTPRRPAPAPTGVPRGSPAPLPGRRWPCPPGPRCAPGGRPRGSWRGWGRGDRVPLSGARPAAALDRDRPTRTGRRRRPRRPGRRPGAGPR